jgi:hypothetical protein
MAFAAFKVPWTHSMSPEISQAPLSAQLVSKTFLEMDFRAVQTTKVLEDILEWVSLCPPQ